MKNERVLLSGGAVAPVENVVGFDGFDVEKRPLTLPEVIQGDYPSSVICVECTQYTYKCRGDRTSRGCLYLRFHRNELLANPDDEMEYHGLLADYGTEEAMRGEWE